MISLPYIRIKYTETMKPDGFQYFEGKVGDIYQYWYCGTYDWDYITEFIISSIFSVTKIKIESVLDCACGGCGEPSITLWEKGFNVCSSDGSKKMLLSAKRKIEEAKANIEFIGTPLFWHDLKEYFGDRKFDAVLCMANSICHTHPDELDSSLKNMTGILQPAGVLVIDTKRYSSSGEELHYETNKGLVERTHINHGTRKLPNGESATMFTEVLYNPEEHKMETIRVIVKYNNGHSYVEDCSFWKYSKNDIVKSLERIGVVPSFIHTSSQPLPEKWKYELIYFTK